MNSSSKTLTGISLVHNTYNTSDTVPIIKVSGLSKEFPGVKALKNIDFEVFPGEVHALVGENGAGKSTLIKCLIGAHIPNDGTIEFEGVPVHFHSPFDSSKLGIEAVHQELMLVPWLSVKQNIFLNRELHIGNTNFFNQKAMEQESKRLLAKFGLDIDVNKPVKNYNPSIWKMIDIARVINLRPKVIIFDEPTAILTEREVDSLFAAIKDLRTDHVAIIYISHRLNELHQIGDKVTVLRDGSKINTCDVSEITDDDLVKMMVGRDVSNYYTRKINQPGKEIVSLNHVNLKKGQKDISLTVREGEIVGIAGLVGSGRTEVAESLIGINKFQTGTLQVCGEKCRPKSPGQMLSKGIVLLPEDRKYSGLILPFSVALNTVLCVFKRWSKILYNTQKEKEYSEMMIKQLSIKTPSATQLVRNLSGGNQQKVVMAKALLTESKLLILDEPTVGVDVGAKEEIHSLMDDFVNKGGGILMVSSDLPEVIGMCDRVYVMYENKIVKQLERNEISEESIAKYMLKKGEQPTCVVKK